MRLIYSLMIAISILVTASFAAGNGYSGEDGQYNGSGNGATQDTMMTEGVVTEINEQDSILVLDAMDGIDTLYYKSESMVADINVGDEITVNYYTKDDKNMIVSIEMMTNGDGSMPDTTNGQMENDTAQEQMNGDTAQEDTGEWFEDTTVEPMDDEM